MFRHVKRIHFIGIGGIGMSGIAEVLCNLGFSVSGSDAKRSKNTDRLETLFDVKISEGHAAENVGDAQVVVYSSAVKDDNPEIVAARERSIPVIPRAEMLAELMTLKPYAVAIAGTHGKTSTTSMIATVLGYAGIDPTTVVGGVVDTLGSNAKLGASEWFVTEADESDRSFLMLYPTIAVVTNIDKEHMESYKGMDDVVQCFVDFVNKVPFYGATVICLDDPNIQLMMPRMKRRRVTYGLTAQAEISARHISYDGFGSKFTVVRRGQVLGEMELPVPGEHNVYNSLAATAVALELEIEFEKIAEAFRGFKNADRRFQFKGEIDGITVIDDYGHHPTEILATLAAAKNAAAGRRKVVVFQPHRYTRTKELMDDFVVAFNNADVLYILDIYAASEAPIEGITAEVLAENIRKFGHRSVTYIGDIETAADKVAPQLQSGDLVITLGAGSVTRLSEEILERLKGREAAA